MRGPGRGHEGLNVPDVQRAVARGGGPDSLPPGAGHDRGERGHPGLPVAPQGARGPSPCSGRRSPPCWAAPSASTRPAPRCWSAAGAAAGISAAFNAPLAGAFFALEEILGSLAVGAFPPVVVASVVAAVVSHIFLGNNPAFPMPEEYGYALQRELLIFYPFLGVVAGLVAALFVRVFFAHRDALPETRRCRAGASRSSAEWWSACWCCSPRGCWWATATWRCTSRSSARMSWTALALLALGSILATSITLSFGGSGGVFTPSLFVGAATGGAFGVALADLFPGLGLRPEAYALVGMGAVVAAATVAPITGMLLVFEMTNDYKIVLPLMLTTVIANLVARRIEPDSLYSGWLRRRGERLQHGADRDVLAGLRVADAFDPAPARRGGVRAAGPAAGAPGSAARTPTSPWWTSTGGWWASSRSRSSAGSPRAPRTDRGAAGGARRGDRRPSR